MALVKGRVPDLLHPDPLPASELAERAGLHALTLTRALRALAAFGAFQEVSPGVFANNPNAAPSSSGAVPPCEMRTGCGSGVRGSPNPARQTYRSYSATTRADQKQHGAKTRRVGQNPPRMSMRAPVVVPLAHDRLGHQHGPLLVAYGAPQVQAQGLAFGVADLLVVIEMLAVPCQPNPGVAILDMMMLLYFGEARQRTVGEYAELFGSAGLEFTRVIATPSRFSIVEARPI